MTTTLKFKDIIDLPLWRPNAPSLAFTGNGGTWAYDMRNSNRNSTFNYFLQNATTLYAYSPQNDEWMSIGSPALTGSFGAGAAATLHPTQGPRGTIAAGATTTSFTLTTALPAAVALNQLANRGDGAGFRIRIIGNAAGSSGKIEERIVIANTAGTTPTITVDTPLSFTPANGDGYEILSGRVYMLSAGTLAAGMWKWYDIATNSFSGNLATTNLPSTGGVDSGLVALSEGHIPNDRSESTGMLGTVTASAATGTTIVAASGIANSLFADEYRNFQVRVVEDTATPTAVGQRRRISTHTSGTTPTFTVAAWAVTPSATAKFVIENDDDKILLFTNQTSIYTYNITANTWDTTTFAAAASAAFAGVVVDQSFGLTRDTTGNSRHSFIYRVRGGTLNTIDVFDIAGAATGTWSADIAYGNKGLTTFSTGMSGAYDPITNGGRYIYLNLNGTQRFLRFDVRNRVLEPWAYMRVPQGTAIVGGKLAMSYFFDGATKLAFLCCLQNSSANQFSIACQR
jgi:hypothetical protein